MNQADLTTLLDYHYWARDVMLDALDPLTPEQFMKDLGSSFKSIRDTVAHIHAADTVWVERWKGGTPTALLPHDRFGDVASVRKAWADLERQARALVGGLGDSGVTKVYDYKMLNGTPLSSPFWHMLTHMVNHASYHRGQVTTMLRQIGAQPAKSMDMISFYRTR